MPIDHEIIPELRLVIARGSGTLTLDDLMQYQMQVWSDPKVEGFDEIADVTAVENFDYKGSTDVRALAKLSAQMDWVNKSNKFAIVAANETAYGLARMYQSYRDAQSISRKEVQVFETMEQARMWLGR
jgi:hypothetical protein